MSTRESVADIVLIGQLNARYAQALDGLLPEAAEAWAATFTPEGRVAVVSADGSMVAQAAGRQGIAQLWHGFSDVAATRHWFNNLLIEVEGDSARLSAYVVAQSIKDAPATIVRTGTYSDRLVRRPDGWLFAERILTLDPASRV